MTPLLIDTDPGIDDALALLLAWASPEVSVDAITAVAGNVTLPMAIRNVWRLLALRRPTPTPAVAAGAEGPLRRPLVTAVRHHGEDGLGDLTDWAPVEFPPSAGAAVDLMHEVVRRESGRLTLVALGPLTNVALALERDRAAMAGIERLVAMGGAVDVPGNVTPGAEFNFHVDPDAADVVFGSGLSIDLVPLDATRQAVLSRPDLLAALERVPGPVASRIAAFTEHAFRSDEGRAVPGMFLHDPLAVGVAIDPTLVAWEPVRLRIGPDGETRRQDGPANCRFARRVDTPRFLDFFLRRLCPSPSRPLAS
jgi:purine nucleosidase/pyrimidine-specific ribonucleoside hydrolase